MSYYDQRYHKSDDDDIPMILNPRYMTNVRSRNVPPLITQKTEVPKLSSFERNVMDMMEQIERNNRIMERQRKELIEVFDDWKIDEPNNNSSYETCTDTNEHVNYVEPTDDNDFDSNFYVTNSSDFVLQDGSEYETDEGEEDDELVPTHELEFIIDSDWEDSDDEDVEDISVVSNSKVVSFSVELSSMNAELDMLGDSRDGMMATEGLHETMETRLDNEPSLDEELLELLGMNDEELEELGCEYGMMSEEELLASLGLSVVKVKPIDEDFVVVVKNDIDKEPLDSESNGIICERDSELVKEPEPRDDLSKWLTRSVPVVSKELKIVKDGDIESNRPPDKCGTTKRRSNYGIVHDPGDTKMFIYFSLDVVCFGYSGRYWIFIRLINKPPKPKWRLDFCVDIFIVEKFYMNRKTYDEFLPCEYDWKGGGRLKYDPT